MWNSQVKIKAEMINEGASRYVFNKKTDWDVQNKHTKENTLCEFFVVDKANTDREVGSILIISLKATLLPASFRVVFGFYLQYVKINVSNAKRKRLNEIISLKSK